MASLLVRMCALAGMVVLLAGCGGSGPQRTTSKPVDRIGVAQPKIVQNAHLKRKMTTAEFDKAFAEVLKYTREHCPSSCTFDSLAVEPPAKQPG